MLERKVAQKMVDHDAGIIGRLVRTNTQKTQHWDHVTYSLHREDASAKSEELETLAPLPLVLVFLLSWP